MSLSSIRGLSRVPPGFRFHPTEEELLHYYLRKKMACNKIDLDVIVEIDLNKLEPWDIEEKCRIGCSTPQNEWYFFSRKDRKYPTGARTNRATASGFWKATGRDKVIYGSSKPIGMRKTLVFYMGRAPRGQISDWILHEYRLEENSTDHNNSESDIASSCVLQTSEDAGWVVCRVFKKKILLKSLDNANNKFSITQDHDNKTKMLRSNRDGALDNVLVHMRGSSKMETEANNTNCMTYISQLSDKVQVLMNAMEADDTITQQVSNNSSLNQANQKDPVPLSDWATVDRLVASHLNGQSDLFKQIDFIDTGNLSLLSMNAMEADDTITQQVSNNSSLNQANQKDPVPLSDRATVDRLVVSHLNGQSDLFKQIDFIDTGNLSLLSIPINQDLLHTDDYDHNHLDIMEL